MPLEVYASDCVKNDVLLKSTVSTDSCLIGEAMNIAGAISGLGSTAGMLGVRRPVVVYRTMMVVLLATYCVVLAVHGFLRQSEEARADLASNAELGARALDSYFGQLDVALRALTDAIGKDVGRIDLDSTAFKVRAADLLTTILSFSARSGERSPGESGRSNHRFTKFGA